MNGIEIVILLFIVLVIIGLAYAFFSWLIHTEKKQGRKNINSIARIIKIITSIIGFVGVTGGLLTMGWFSLVNTIVGASIIVISLISSVIMYGLGEIIQLLQDIKQK